MFSALVRTARPVVARGFATSARSNKDFVTELYVKELKSYKPNPNIKDIGTVKAYSTPAAPVAPVALDSAALAKELEAYDADVVAHVEEAPKAAAGAVDASEETLGASEYLRLVEADTKHEAKH